MVEPSGDTALLLVNLLHAFKLLVLGDGLEIIHSTVEQRDTNVGSLERADIVGTVTSHKSSVAELLERVEDEFLLRWRDTRVNPSVVDKVTDGRSVLELLESGTGNTDIVVSEHDLVERLLWVAGDELRLVDIAPDQFVGGCAFLQVKDHDLTVDNFNISSNVNSGKRVVTGNHDTLRVRKELC